MIQKRKISKSRRIADQIRAELHTIEAVPGTPAASASEIAGQFGVSVPTAHNAINLLVEEGLLYRVRGSGTFICEQRQKKALRIGLADCSIYPLSPEMQKLLNYHIDCVLDFFSETDCRVKVISYSELTHPKSSEELFSSLDALMVSYNYIDPETVVLLKQSGLPVVVYRHEFEADLPFSQVVYDLSPGMDRAIAQCKLTAADRPVIIYVDTPSGNASRKAWIKRLAMAGIPESALTFHQIDSFGREVACYRLARVHGASLQGRMLLFSSDDLTMTFISAMYDESMSPGIDYRLLSIGNQEEYGLNLPGGPMIASVHLPKKTMAEESCRLLQHLSRSASNCSVLVRVPTSFVMRPSGIFAQKTTPLVKGF